MLTHTTHTTTTTTTTSSSSSNSNMEHSNESSSSVREERCFMTLVDAAASLLNPSIMEKRTTGAASSSSSSSNFPSKKRPVTVVSVDTSSTREVTNSSPLSMPPPFPKKVDALISPPPSLPTPPPQSDAKKLTFPELLMSVLDDDALNLNVLTWMPNGEAFTIRDPKRFTREHMPNIFNIRNMSSFVRKLGRWGFSRVHERETRNSDIFKHKHFQRNGHGLCATIRCVGRPAGGPQTLYSPPVSMAKGATTCKPSDHMIPMTSQSSSNNNNKPFRVLERAGINTNSPGPLYHPILKRSQQSNICHSPPQCAPSSPYLTGRPAMLGASSSAGFNRNSNNNNNQQLQSLFGLQRMMANTNTAPQELDMTAHVVNSAIGTIQNEERTSPLFNSSGFNLNSGQHHHPHHRNLQQQQAYVANNTTSTAAAVAEAAKTLLSTQLQQKILADQAAAASKLIADHLMRRSAGGMQRGGHSNNAPSGLAWLTESSKGNSAFFRQQQQHQQHPSSSFY